MQIRKSYDGINPTLLYDELKELVLKQGADLRREKLETYSLPSDSSSFIHRGILLFNIRGEEALRVHLNGSDKGITKLMLDINEVLFPSERIAILEDELNYILGSFEAQ